MLVGDVLLSAREAVPDLPGVLSSPLNEISILAVGVTANPLPVGTYYLQATYTNAWGETSPGPEVTVAIAASQAIQISPAASFYVNFNIGLNVYMGAASGSEIQQYVIPAPLAASFTIDAAALFGLSTPPTGNSAFLPDSGGTVASASQIFRWLNDALLHISALNGGIPDMSGFSTQGGKANYTLPGDWQSLSDGWYDGYPLFMGSSSLVFRHNTITALAGMMSFTQVADTLVVELFAQPNRYAGVAGLSAALAANATAANIAAPTGWVLPFGLAMIGTEIVSYTMQGNVLASMVRGLGGTNAQAWANGTPVFELNCMFKGLRAAQIYQPGMAGNTLRLPSSWTPLIHLYILARYRRIEQQESDAAQLTKEFEAGAREATKRKPALGDNQIQPQDQVGVDIYPLLSRTFGGGIIP